MPAPKRLVNLRGSDKFRYVGGTGGTNWTSCNKAISGPRFLGPQSLVRNLAPAGSLFLSGNTAGLILTTFAIFAFAPLTIPGLVAGYYTTATGVATAYTTGALGQAGYFATGLLSTLGFASPHMQTPRYTAFNRPCADPGGN